MTDQEFEAELRRRLGHPVDRLMVHVCGVHVNHACQLHVTEYSRAWGCPGQSHEILNFLAAMHTSLGRAIETVLKRYCEDNGLNYQEKLGFLFEAIDTLARDNQVASGSSVYTDLGKTQHGTQDGLPGDKAP